MKGFALGLASQRRKATRKSVAQEARIAKQLSKKLTKQKLIKYKFVVRTGNQTSLRLFED